MLIYTNQIHQGNEVWEVSKKFKKTNIHKKWDGLNKRAYLNLSNMLFAKFTKVERDHWKEKKVRLNGHKENIKKQKVKKEILGSSRFLALAWHF